MSNPISKLPSADDLRPEEGHDEPELEVDELTSSAESAESAESADADIPELEIDPLESETDSEGPSGDAAPEAEDTPAEESKGRMGIVALVLAVLLVVSFAINLKQSRDVSALEGQNAEIEQALTAAVDRIDAETARANGAESALDRVDVAVDIVNEKVLGLQEALDGLREATIR